MEFEITRGKRKEAQKIVLYGPEGIGKSTFAAQFPDVLFIDTEGSTKELDVARLPKPTSWAMLGQELRFVKENRPCRTIAIDTIDWAETLCVEHVCDKHGKQGIEDFGYGNGYIYAKEELGRLLNRLEELIERGIHVVLTAHAQIRKFEQPDEMGAYDRYELKLGKKTGSQTSPLVKEWADMVLFANYKTQSVSVDDKGKKHKAQGGKRVMHTSHHPCWDAKNRHGLPEELPFEYAAIAHCLPDLGGPTREPSQEPAMEPPKTAPEPPAGPKAQDPEAKPMEAPAAKTSEGIPAARPKREEPPAPEPPKRAPAEPAPEQPKDPEAPKTREENGSPMLDEREEALKQLFDLMERTGVDRRLLQHAVGKRGFYPNDTPIEHYATDFIRWLPSQWERINEIIKQLLEEDIPF